MATLAQISIIEIDIKQTISNRKIYQLLSLLFDVVVDPNVQLTRFPILIVSNKHHNNSMMKDYYQEHYELVQD